MSNKKIRHIIKHIIKEGLNNQELLDKILDKISASGVDSLTQYERKTLNALSAGITNDLSNKKQALNFLNSNFSDLIEKEYQLDKLGKKVSGIYYIDKNQEMVFDFHIYSEVLGITKKPNQLYAPDVLLDKLSENFDLSKEEAKEVIKLWFEKKTNHQVSYVGFYFTNQD